MAFSKYGGALNSGGATGFGVRLLNNIPKCCLKNNRHCQLKRDAVERNLTDKIKNIFIKKNNLIIKDSKKIHITKDEASEFYKVHQSKPFITICTYLSSGPIVVMILEGENAVLANRKLMGATNPKDAEENTIRKLYGISIDKNSVHGSDLLIMQK